MRYAHLVTLPIPRQGAKLPALLEEMLLLAAYFTAIVAFVAGALAACPADFHLWIGGAVFLMILGFVSFSAEFHADAALLMRWLKRRDGPMLYTRSVGFVMRILARMMLPRQQQTNLAPLPVSCAPPTGG